MSAIQRVAGRVFHPSKGNGQSKGPAVRGEPQPQIMQGPAGYKGNLDFNEYGRNRGVTRLPVDLYLSNLRQFQSEQCG